jgi:hypothetical protein
MEFFQPEDKEGAHAVATYNSVQILCSEKERLWNETNICLAILDFLSNPVLLHF